MDALALVGFRLLQLADASSSLADELLVDTGHREQRLGLRRNRELDALGGVMVIVWEKPRENSRSLALGNHAVTGTRDLETPFL